MKYEELLFLRGNTSTNGKFSLDSWSPICIDIDMFGVCLGSAGDAQLWHSSTSSGSVNSVTIALVDKCSCQNKGESPWFQPHMPLPALDCTSVMVYLQLSDIVWAACVMANLSRTCYSIVPTLYRWYEMRRRWRRHTLTCVAALTRLDACLCYCIASYYTAYSTRRYVPYII